MVKMESRLIVIDPIGLQSDERAEHVGLDCVRGLGLANVPGCDGGTNRM